MFLPVNNSDILLLSGTESAEFVIVRAM